MKYHDLFLLRATGSRKPLICWLRLFSGEEGEGKWVAVLTEVPGNPGFSISNGHKHVVSALTEKFGTGLISGYWFHVWPQGLFSTGPSWSEVDATGREIGPSCRAAVERLVGMPLLDLPQYDKLYRRVIELGGGCYQEQFRQVFEAIPVAELPPPHNPASCCHYERFLEILKNTPDVKGALERELEAGKRFLCSLTVEDVRRCPYHEADWRAVAEESVCVLEECGEEADVNSLLERAEKARLPEVEKEWLCSLFEDPIFIGGGGYTNGQHRGCALRFSGALRAAIHTRDESLGYISVDWTYEGDG
jgi:hypothetical protein